MELINLQRLSEFIASAAVEVAIQDEEGDDRAPFIRKEVTKVELCPDHTHVRIYFDQQKFFAVPLGSTVLFEDKQWSAYDQLSNLTYIIRRVEEQ
ncbi:hypothetical protein [Bacillus dakarensis]|uniref:hypothetical protein n=1 Tax=Robertmurraya dakarensis TaxID=1926278 RepID=UPI00098149D5|nr:hypothetical protein [Bacillus dakarensis]